MSHHYTFDELVAALRQVGVQAGDVIFTHVDLAALGMPELANANLPSRNRRALGEAICRLIYTAVTQVIGDGGTWLVPTYSYSFGKQAIFDPVQTPSEVGVFTEWFRQQADVMRSDDPMFSVAGLGPQTAALFADLPHDCFGPDCVYDRLRRVGAKIVNLGVGVRDMTFLHHVEQSVGVPYRFKKLFLGQQMLNDNNGDAPHLHKTGWLYNVRPFTENCRPAFDKLDPVLRQHGQLRRANLGMGEVLSIPCDDLFACAANELAHDAWFLAQGPALSHAELLAKEEARALGNKAEIGYLSDTRFLTTQNLIDTLWRYPRDIVSAGYDAALNLIAQQFPPNPEASIPNLTIHEFPSGTEAFTWVVPEAWHCQEAYLETLDGRRLFSYADHPLHVVSYSLPFEGVVSRAELFAHLHTHPLLPHATPFKFKYYERNWGLCCSADLKRSLTDDTYRVVIRSTFTYGTLKVAEIVAQGHSSHSFVLCAHLCHPHQVNDDLAGVVVGINIMRELLKRASQPNGLHYTYRLLILPETIGSVAWLKNLELKIENCKSASPLQSNPKLPILNSQPASLFGGLFLEMLGTDLPHSLQLSLQGDTPLDKLMMAAVQQHDADSWVGAFNTVIGNDERQFNAPGIRVPMLSLSRVHRPDHPHYPYPQYHSTDDTPDIISAARLDDSAALVLKIIDEVEGLGIEGLEIKDWGLEVKDNITTNPQSLISSPQSPIPNSQIPIPNYKGEVFLSRYGIHIDPTEDPEGRRHLFKVMNLIDGTRSLAQIAAISGAPLDAVQRIVALLQTHKLAEF